MTEARVTHVALMGLAVNTVLAGVKLVAGLLGNSYALVADAVEALVDIGGSLVIWLGLRYARRPADADHPYGHGRAEALAGLTVAGMICVAAVGIAVEAVQEILMPHHAPAWWTLAVLVAVVVTKEGMARYASRAARAAGSTAGAVDAGHHRSDALTSLAAFLGIGVSLWGGPGWESADDWAALAASGVILYNGISLARPALDELLDRQPATVVARAVAAASRVPGVTTVQKAWARQSGTRVYIDMHVWVPGNMTVREAHAIAHAVKDVVRAELPRVRDVLVHIEPDGSDLHPRPPA